MFYNHCGYVIQIFLFKRFYADNKTIVREHCYCSVICKIVGWFNDFKQIVFIRCWKKTNEMSTANKLSKILPFLFMPFFSKTPASDSLSFQVLTGRLFSELKWFNITWFHITNADYIQNGIFHVQNCLLYTYNKFWVKMFMLFGT